MIEKIHPNVVAVDAGDGDGRNLYWYLGAKYDASHLFAYQGAENIRIGLAKDENGNQIYGKNGELEYVYEKQHRWGAEMIKNLFYERRISCFKDYELDTQLSSVVAIQRSNGVVYQIASENDHLWNALKVFGCAIWDKEEFVVDEMGNKQMFKGFV